MANNQRAYAVVDVLHAEHPTLVKDVYFDTVLPDLTSAKEKQDFEGSMPDITRTAQGSFAMTASNTKLDIAASTTAAGNGNHVERPVSAASGHAVAAVGSLDFMAASSAKRRNRCSSHLTDIYVRSADDEESSVIALHDD
jgi:hypothetical protein